MKQEEYNLTKLIEDYKKLGPIEKMRFLEIMRKERRKVLLERKSRSIRSSQRTTACITKTPERGVSINFGPRPGKQAEDSENSQRKDNPSRKPR